MQKLSLIVFIATLCFGAQADVLTYSYTGTVYLTDPFSPSGIQVGNQVTGTVTFADGPVTSQSDTGNGTLFFYNGAVKGITLAVGSYAGFLGPTFQGDNYLSVINTFEQTPLFSDSVGIFSPLQSNVIGDNYLARVNFQFVDTTSMLIDSPAIPIISLADFDEIPGIQITEWSDPLGGPSYTHLASIDTFELIDVQPDTDNDGTLDSVDNCVLIDNSNQTDTDNDGYGNACDGDFNNDCAVNFLDLSLFAGAFLSNNPLFDLDSNSIVNFIDLSKLSGLFFLPPGPSGTTQACD